MFDAIVTSAARLCDAGFSAVARLGDDGLLHLAALNNMSVAETAAYHSLFPRSPHRGFAMGRAFLEGRPVHIEDVRRDAEYESRTLEVLQRAAPYRTFLAIPIIRAGEPIGAIGCGRRDVRPFTDAQIALVQTFAEQAVIAIENVRLFTEVQARNRDLTESLEQQTATGEILGVISSSPTDVQPVFDTIASNARRLCRADSGGVYTYDGALIHLQSLDNTSPEGGQALRRAYPMPATVGSGAGRAILTATPVHIPDVQDEADYGLAGVRGAGLRSLLCVPMLRDGIPIGIIAVHSWGVPRPFTQPQIDLLKTFAAQAVIAIQNVHLFTELQRRNGELTESLEQQTATGEILRVISGSPTDVQPVFDAITESAVRLCEGFAGALLRFDGESMYVGAVKGPGRDQILRAWEGFFPYRPGPEVAIGQAVLERRVIHFPDVLALPSNPFRGATQRAGGYRAFLAVPMLRDDHVVGVIACWRTEPRAFTDRHISLVQTFADQAVIAIENVRLFTELEARNRDLTDSLEQQTATGDILRTISGSLTDAQPVFDAIVRSAVRLCHARFALVYRVEGDVIIFVAHHNLPPGAVDQFQRTFPQQLSDSPTLVAQAIRRREIVNVPDISAYSQVSEAVRELARSSGYRSVLAVPIMREGHALGAIAIARSGPEGDPDPFSSDEIPLLRTFSDQAGIAIENVRLFNELQARTHDLTRSVGELQALGEVSRAVSSTLDLETVLSTIVSRAVQLSESYAGIAYEFDEATQSFHARASHQISSEFLDAVRAAPIRLGQGTVGRAGVQRAPVEVTDLEAEADLVAAQVRRFLARAGCARSSRCR